MDMSSCFSKKLCFGFESLSENMEYNKAIRETLSSPSKACFLNSVISCHKMYSCVMEFTVGHSQLDTDWTGQNYRCFVQIYTFEL